MKQYWKKFFKNLKNFPFQFYILLDKKGGEGGSLHCLGYLDLEREADA